MINWSLKQFLFLKDLLNIFFKIIQGLIRPIQFVFTFNIFSYDYLNNLIAFAAFIYPSLLKYLLLVFKIQLLNIE